MQPVCVRMTFSIICQICVCCSCRANVTAYLYFNTQTSDAQYMTTVHHPSILHHPAQTQHSYKFHFSVRRQMSAHCSNQSNVKLFPLCSKVETSGRVIMLMHINQLLAWISTYPLTFRYWSNSRHANVSSYVRKGQMITVTFSTWILRHGNWTCW